MIRKDIVSPGEDYTIEGFVFSFGFQPDIREHGEFVVWYDTNSPKWCRVTTKVTGADVPAGFFHLGTAMTPSGGFVLHGFYRLIDAGEQIIGGDDE